jgi:hypothetical protein
VKELDIVHGKLYHWQVVHLFSERSSIFVSSGLVQPVSTIFKQTMDFKKETHTMFPIAIVRAIKSRNDHKILRHGKIK